MYRYSILPSGNLLTYPTLDEELIKRGVKAHYCQNANGARIYRIHSADLERLPKDTNGPYLGNAKWGHALYPMEDIDTYRKDLNCGEWTEIVLKK